jgi:hypothetical protein
MTEDTTKKQKIQTIILRFLNTIYKGFIFIFKNLLSILISILEIFIKKILEIIEALKTKL